MKANKNFMLREVAGEHILIPVNEAAKKLYGLITLNDSGLLLWNRLQEGCSQEELIQAMLDEYEVDRETAERDTEIFLQKMREIELLEE